MKLIANGTVDIEAMGTLQDEFQFLVQKTSLEVGPILYLHDQTGGLCNK